MKSLVIVGAGGHGKVAADCAAQNRYKNIYFLDDDREVKSCGKYPVAGTVAEFRKFMDVDYSDTDFFVAIGNAAIRQKIHREIETAGGVMVTLIHPDAVISDDVRIGSGTVIMAGTVINTGAIIGAGCIVNTASSVDHDCHIGDFVHIAVGAHIAGTVGIGDRTWVGAGAIVSNNVHICGDCMIGAGAVVVSDIRISGTYVGIPAKIMGGLL
ncbi:MAG: acetyltransferase [Hungatella sp.]|jgi:sugar O-acyltransferase (sialic acid O-acetyltransferase NeuD family)|nr:acetyltransferase [Hungatella sp.]